MNIKKSASGIIAVIVVLALAGCAGPFDGDVSDKGEASLSFDVRGLDLVGSSDEAVTAQSAGSEIGARAINPSGIVSAEVTVDALNFPAPVTQTVSLAGGGGTATIAGLQIGPNRVIQVVGYDGGGNAVAGAEIYATVDLYPGDNSVTVNWDTTPRGRVFAELLARDRSDGTDYSVTVDAAAVQTRIEGVVSANGLGHPNVVDAAALAGDIISNGGAIPSSNSFVRATGSVSLNITGMGSIVGWPVEIVVTDPTSQAISVSGDGAYTIDEVLPGDWDMILSINDGAYEAAYALSEVVAGSSTSSASDADGNSVDLASWDLSGVLNTSIRFAGDIPADPGVPEPDAIPVGERELVTSGSVVRDPDNPALVEVNLTGIIDPETGTPYEDLTADNFVVVEDGVVQGFRVESIERSGSVGLADIVFVIDTTGSMGSEIDGVKASVTDFLADLETRSLDINVAGYAYADDIVEKVELTSDISDSGSFHTWVNGLSASYMGESGGDTPEDGLDPIADAMDTLEWRPGAQRIFVLLTDAPFQEENYYSDWSVETLYSEKLAGNAVVHAVGNADREDDLASISGGRWVEMPADGNVDLRTMPISTVIAAGYKIVFETSYTSGDRTIRVVYEVEGKDGEFSVTASYD